MLKSIRKEMKTTSNLKLGKLTLDILASPVANVEKTVKFINRNIGEEELTLDNLKKAIETFFEYKPEELDGLEQSKPSLYLGLGASFHDYSGFVQFQDPHKETRDILYFDMKGKLPQTKNGNRYTWRNNSQGSFGVYNGKRLIAVHKLYSELIKYNPELAVLKSYIMSTSFYKGQWYSVNEEKSGEILKAIMDVYEDDLNIKLMEDYERAQSGDYAKSFMTKKNINASVMAQMEITSFKDHGFSFVEFDNETDLEKVAAIEEEWALLYKDLPKVQTKTDLRFRKLGNHKATGLYYPTQHSLCVDIRDVSAMLHEYGHLLDYEYSDGTISLSEDFRSMVKRYRANMAMLKPDSYVNKKKMYYGTPTEVFARGFEIYMSGKTESSFLKDKQAYETDDAYKCFDDQMRFELVTFFDNLLG